MRSISEQKEKLRTQVQQWRTNLDSSTYEKWCSLIAEQVLDMSAIKQADVIHTYVSMNDRREIDTHDIIEQLLRSGKIVVVPRMLSKGQLAHHQISGLEDLSENSWGVQEPDPDTCPQVEVSELEAVVVPLSAADRHCHRLGYGKGFYDRFLATLDIPTMGLCYEQWLLDSIPVDDFDVPLGVIVTEEQIFRCSKS